MLQSGQGSFTVLDPHTTNTKYFWQGIEVEHVISMTIHVKGAQRVRLLVTHPAAVEPELSPTARAELEAVYAAMSAAGINVQQWGSGS